MRDSLLGLLLFCCVTASALYQLGHSRRMCLFTGQCVAQRNDDDHKVDHRAEEKRLAQERREALQRKYRNPEMIEEARGSRQREFVPSAAEPNAVPVRSRVRG